MEDSLSGNFWIALKSIPEEGADFKLVDQNIWLAPLREFGISCSITRPLEATLHVLPQEEGIWVRGRITGQVAMPCNRCAEEALVEVNQTVEDFEPYPLEEFTIDPVKGFKSKEEPAPKTMLDNEVDYNVMRFAPSGPRMAKEIEINLAALAWEEFSLALPVKPLCSDDCPGLCPICGTNRKQGNCDCADEAGDPRLAVLRGLKIDRGSASN